MNLVTFGMSNRSYLAPVVFGIVGIDVYLTCLFHSLVHKYLSIPMALEHSCSHHSL